MLRKPYVKPEINGKSLRALLEKQQYRCALTGATLTPDNASLDHIVPVCRGGEIKALSNVHIVTKAANRMKSTLTTDELVQMCWAILHFQQERIRHEQMETRPVDPMRQEHAGESRNEGVHEETDTVGCVVPEESLKREMPPTTRDTTKGTRSNDLEDLHRQHEGDCGDKDQIS